jgi:hypothetical protein
MAVTIFLSRGVYVTLASEVLGYSTIELTLDTDLRPWIRTFRARRKARRCYPHVKTRPRQSTDRRSAGS